MRFKRTPEKEDAAILKYCGIMGHRFASTIMGSDGRRGYAESMQLDSEVFKGDSLRVFEQLRKKDGGRKWKRVL